VVLGPFNNGLQTAGAVPELVDGCSTQNPNDTCDPSVLLFTDDTGGWSNVDGRDIHFARIDAAIQRLRDAGVYPVIMGYPDPALLDLDSWLAVFGASLPPWTEVTTTAGIETLAEYNRQRYEGRLGEGILYVPTDEIPAEDIGDGLHLEYVYHKLSARALARTIAAHQAFLDAFGF
jgi:hypothetical protein